MNTYSVGRAVGTGGVRGVALAFTSSISAPQSGGFSFDLMFAFVFALESDVAVFVLTFGWIALALALSTCEGEAELE